MNLNTTKSNEFNKNIIEPAALSDYPRLLAIWESAVMATHNFLTEKDFEYYKKRMYSYFSQVSLYTFKTSDEEIAGFIGISDSNIEMLFVDDTYRGLGIGKELLLYAVNYLKADKLDVNEQNEKAIGFYIHMGFKIVGRSLLDHEGKNYPLLHMLYNRTAV